MACTIRHTMLSTLAAVSFTHAVFGQETQTFDSEASAASSGWMANEEGQNPDRDCDGCETDLGWKNSNFAGGVAAGEGGGLTHRSGGLPIGFYADTTIGELTLDMPISASGKVSLVDVSADGHYHFGFFDGQRVLDDPLDIGAHLGFFLAEPGGGVAPNFRWGHTIRTDNELVIGDHAGFLDGAAPEESLDFLIDYDPSGDGTLTLAIGDDEPLEVPLTPDLRADGATLTAFGIWTATTPGSARSDFMEIYLDDLTYTSAQGGGAAALQAGDADQDYDFDQLDLVKVQVAAKYLSGQAATWGDGDWDGAPGGEPGSPPAGNGLFDQLDIIKALASGFYLAGPYAAIQPGGNQGDDQTSIVYNANTGELSVDAPVGSALTSINIDSAAGIFTGDAAQNLGGSFDNDADDNIFKATFGDSFGSLSFGAVAQTGLAESFVLDDLTVVGSLAGGGDLGNVDLIYVPEPTSVGILGIGIFLVGLARRRRRAAGPQPMRCSRTGPRIVPKSHQMARSLM